jgi:hypothetical protein
MGARLGKEWKDGRMAHILEGKQCSPNLTMLNMTKTIVSMISIEKPLKRTLMINYRKLLR